MTKRRSLLALFAVFFVAALFAVPSQAKAGAFTLYQRDFQYSDGSPRVFYMTPGWAYELGEDVRGAVCVDTSARPIKQTSLDLKGHTITNPEGFNHDVVSVGMFARVVITNSGQGGGLVQQNSSYAVASTFKHKSAKLYLELGSGSATVTNHTCVSSNVGNVYILSGTYVTTNTDGSTSPVIETNGQGAMSVKNANMSLEGDTDGVTPIKNNGTGIVLNGGTYGFYPSGASGCTGGSVLYYDTTAGTYTITTAKAAKAAHAYCVTGVDGLFSEVYFDSKTDAEEFQKSEGGSKSEVKKLSCTVKFNTKGGTPTQIGSQEILYSGKVDTSKVVEPTKTGYFFLGWTYDNTGKYYDFDTPVTRDLTLEAQWATVVAKIGDTPYASLQSAVDAAGEGDVITLETNTLESVKVPAGGGLTINLNGHYLRAQSGSPAIEVQGARSLAVTGGYVYGNIGDGIVLGAGSDGSTLTLGDSDGRSLQVKCEDSTGSGTSMSALRVESASAVNAVSGTYSTASERAAVVSCAGAELNVTSGSFVGAGGAGETVKVSQGTATVNSGWFTGHVASDNQGSGSTVTIDGGAFGDNGSRAYVVAGKVLYREGDYYEVKSVDKAKASASWVVTDAGGNKVYYKNKSAADADAATLGASVKQLFTVAFYNDGARVALNYVEAGDAVGDLPTTPTREGYTFAGWYSGDEAVTADTVVNSYITAKARWTKDEPAPEPTPSPEPETKTYTVSFDSAGGTNVDAQTVEENETATEPAKPTREGYDFDGWFLGAAASAYEFETPVTADITLTARWTEHEPEPVTTYYSVTFNTDGGSAAPAWQRVKEGETATEPTDDPTRDGYTFSGWTLNGVAYEFDTPVTSNITLVASWTPVLPATYTVTFDSVGGSQVASQTVIDGQAANEPDEPTKKGSVFYYWKTSDGGPYIFGTPVTDDITLTAEWVSPVAAYNGVSYLSLQDAIDAVPLDAENPTVTLLDDAAGTVNVGGLSNLTIDLDGHKFSAASSAGAAIDAVDCPNLTIKNGEVDVADKDYGSNVTGISLTNCTGFALEDLTVNVSSGIGDAVFVEARTIDEEKGESSGTVVGGSYSSVDGMALCASATTLEVKGGTFNSTNSVALYAESSSVEVNGGTFTTGEGNPDQLAAVFAEDASVTVGAGSFSGYIELNERAGLTVNGGSLTCVDDIADETETPLLINGGEFAYPDNLDSLAEGKAFYKAKGGNYKVVSYDKAWDECAAWAVLGDYEAYYEDVDDAKAVLGIDYEEEEGSYFHEVKLVSRGKLVKTAFVLDGYAIGKLPAGEEVAGYTFAGWFEGDDVRGTDFEPTKDVTLVAKWTEKGSGDKGDDKGGAPTDDPSDKGGESSEKDGKKLPQSGDSTLSTGTLLAVVAAGVVLVVVGVVVSRRKK